MIKEKEKRFWKLGKILNVKMPESWMQQGKLFILDW